MRSISTLPAYINLFLTNGLASQEKNQTDIRTTDIGNPLSPNSTFKVGDGVVSHSSYQVLSVNSKANVYITDHTNPIMSKYGKLASQVSHHAGIMRVFENMRKTMNEKLLTLRIQKTNFNSFKIFSKQKRNQHHEETPNARRNLYKMKNSNGM